jgi:hypothetical protein
MQNPPVVQLNGHPDVGYAETVTVGTHPELAELPQSGTSVA